MITAGATPRQILLVQLFPFQGGLLDHSNRRGNFLSLQRKATVLNNLTTIVLVQVSQSACFQPGLTGISHVSALGQLMSSNVASKIRSMNASLI